MDRKSNSKRALSPAQIEREQKITEAERLSYISQSKKDAKSLLGSMEDFQTKSQGTLSVLEHRRVIPIHPKQYQVSTFVSDGEVRHTDSEAWRQRAQEQLQQNDPTPRDEINELKKTNDLLTKKFTALQISAITEIKEANRSRAASERDRDSWRMKVEEIADELADCKDKLFSLQPQDTVTDTQVGEEWNTLCQHIARWVDDEINVTDNAPLHLHQLTRDGLLPKMARLYWDENCQCLIERYSMKDDFDWLLRHNIHCLLETHIFNESIYFFGLPESVSNTIARVERAFENLEPQREQLNIDHWRSEGLSAISAEPEMMKRREDDSQWVTKQAAVMLKAVVPDLSQKAMENFHVNITLAAIDLASAIRRSLKQYRFDFGLDQVSRQPKRRTLMPQHGSFPIYQHEVDRFEMFDLKSRRKVRSSQALSVNSKKQIGEEVLLIHPALYRCKAEVKVKCLVKATLLINLLKPVIGMSSEDQG